MRPYYSWKIESDHTWTKIKDIQPTYVIKNSKPKGWQSKAGTIYQQTFDGRYVYLYYYEFELNEPIELAIQRKKGDLHLLYPLQNEGLELTFCHESGDIPLHIQHEGSYTYSPKGNYKLNIAAGKHILIGFIIDAGVIRPPASRAYDFITPLVEAKRSKSPTPLQSPGFKIGPLTMKVLHNLFQNLRPKEIRNEAQFLSYIIYLIELSRLKLMLAADKEQMQQPNKLIVHARELLMVSIHSFGAKATLSDVAKSLDISGDKLGLLHKQYYQCSFQQYRNELLLAHVVHAIIESERLLDAAIECGFAGVPEMSRFVKGQTGHPPGFFK